MFPTASRARPAICTLCALAAGWILIAALAGVPAAQTLPPELFLHSRPSPPPLEAFEGMPVGRIYCSGNRRTRARVIVQEILMEPGDPFDPELARESVRNLRALDYLSAAAIIPHPDPGAGTVDLEVAVRDSWPWVGAVIPSFAGGEEELGMLVANGNFFGRGQTVGAYVFLSSQMADSFSFFFVEPRIGGSRWGGALNLGKQGDVGNLNRIEVFRRLYSLSTPWGYDLALFDESEERILYDSGVTVADYYRKRRGGSAGVVRSFLDRDRRLELGVRCLYREDVHRQAEGWSGAIAEDKTRATLGLEATAERVRFVEDRYVNLMGPVEDLRLGIRGTLRAGGALEILGSDRSYPELGAALRWFQGTPPSGYVLVEADVRTRLESGELTNTVLRSAARGYRRLPGEGMLAANLELSVLDRMEDPEQLLLDSPNGLRGYPAYSHDGTRRLLTNLEWRQPFWRLSWVNLASVLFTDGGIIWSGDEPLEEAPFLVGVGVGTRLGFPGFLGAPVTRLDVGYGFKVRSWELSFGFDQRF